jgi:hypothetical protein
MYRALRLVLVLIIIALVLLQVLFSLKLDLSPTLSSWSSLPQQQPQQPQHHSLHITTNHGDDEYNNHHSLPKSLLSKTKQQQHSQQQHQLFPRWADPNGIPLQPLLNFSYGATDPDLNTRATTIRWKKSRSRFPEVLYTVNQTGIHVSRTLRDRTWKRQIPYRVAPTEGVMQLAWSRLMTETTTDDDRWNVLREAVTSGGFPFLVWYGDHKSCNHLNWNKKHSIPLFTTCAHIDCQYAFPLPTYKTIRDSQATSEDWQPILNSYATDYPTESKIRKLVWRGSLSGENDDMQSARWRLGKVVTEQDATGLFDVGLVSIPSRHDHLNLDLTEVGGLAKPMHPMTEFQKYVAVLDIDGNSWSSRFGTLLCYNSVIVKVEPEYVDYFHFKDLQPWKHYVPVKSDLSDLVEQAAFVTDPANDEAVREIVANANDWCRRRMVWTAIAEDVLDIWDAYVRLLRQANVEWMDEWKRAQTSNNFTALFRIVPITRTIDKELISRKGQRGKEATNL